MLERVIEYYLIKRVKALGGEIRKLKYIARRSATDRLVLLPGRHFFAELKRSKVKAEDHQSREHKKLEWAGCEVHLLDTFEKIDEVLK